MKSFILFFSIFLLSISSIAQNKLDILRYTYYQPIMPARVEATGGAFGSLGSEYGALYINPAGIAAYRSNDISFSLFHQRLNNKSLFFGNSIEDQEARTSFGNFGFVYAYTEDLGAVKAINFGLGFQKVHDFENQVLFSGYNAENSILDNYAESINSTEFIVFPEEIEDFYPDLRGAAVLSGLLEYDSATTFYYPIIAGDVQQTIEQDQIGGISDFNMNLGVNIQNKLFLGGSLNFPFMNYTSVRLHSESDLNDIYTTFENFTQTENLTVSGSGIQAKLGLIYLPTSNIRLGASIHTPTAWNLYENYEVYLDANYQNSSYIGNSYVFDYQYNMRTPGKWNVSGAVILNKFAFINVDYETTYMQSGRINFDDFEVDQSVDEAINEDVRNSFQSFSTLRIGGELRFKFMRLRGGYANTSSPFKDQSNEWGIHTLTAGIGVKTNTWYTDLSFANQISDYTDLPYEVSPDLGKSQGALIQQATNRIMLSVGRRF